MSKVSIGEDEYEVADLLAYQHFNLWLYELVLDAVDGSDDEEVVEELEGGITKCQTNIDWLRAVDPD
ncbi:hypothetical protein OAW22_00400 [Pseudomonadales bacterium]|nr:hypothetical protein [Pseudomonadales bacterium]